MLVFSAKLISFTSSSPLNNCLIILSMILAIILRSFISCQDTEEFCFQQTKQINGVYLLGDHLLLKIPDHSTKSRVDRLFRIYNYKSGHLSARIYTQEQIFPSTPYKDFRLKYVNTFDLCQLFEALSLFGTSQNTNKRIKRSIRDDDGSIFRNEMKNLMMLSSQRGSRRQDLEDQVQTVLRNILRKELDKDHANIRNHLEKFDDQLKKLNSKLSNVPSDSIVDHHSNVVANSPVVNSDETLFPRKLAENLNPKCGKLIMATFCSRNSVSFENQLCHDDESLTGCKLKTKFFLYLSNYSEQKDPIKFYLIPIPFKLQLMSNLLTFRGLFQMSNPSLLFEISSNLRCNNDKMTELIQNDRLFKDTHPYRSLISGFQIGLYDLLQTKPGYLEYLDGSKMRISEFLNCFENSTVLHQQPLAFHSGGQNSYGVMKDSGDPYPDPFEEPIDDYPPIDPFDNFKDNNENEEQPDDEIEFQPIKGKHSHKKKKKHKKKKGRKETSTDATTITETLTTESEMMKNNSKNEYAHKKSANYRSNEHDDYNADYDYNDIHDDEDDNHHHSDMKGKSKEHFYWLEDPTYRWAAIGVIFLLCLIGCFFKKDQNSKKINPEDDDFFLPPPSKTRRKSRRKSMNRRKPFSKKRKTNVKSRIRSTGRKRFDKERPTNTKLKFKKVESGRGNYPVSNVENAKANPNYENETVEGLHKNVMVIDPQNIEVSIVDPDLTDRIECMMDESRLITKMISYPRTLFQSIVREDGGDHQFKMDKKDQQDQETEFINQPVNEPVNLSTSKRKKEEMVTVKIPSFDQKPQDIIDDLDDDKNQLQELEEPVEDQEAGDENHKNENYDSDPGLLSIQNDPVYSKLTDENTKLVHILHRLTKSLQRSKTPRTTSSTVNF